MSAGTEGKTLTVLGVAEHRDPAFQTWSDMGLLIHVGVAHDAHDTSWHQLAESVIRLDLASTPSILEAIPQSDGVTTLSEFAVEIAATVAEVRSLPGPTSRAASTVRNKHLLRQVLKENGLDDDFISAEIRSESDLDTFFDVQGERAYVLKPTDSSGSAGVVRVSTLSDAKKNYRVATQWSFNGTLVIEEYIAGPEYSYEGWVQDSNPTLVAVVRKETTEDFVEIGHFTPHAPDRDAWILVQSALRALGVENGVFHAELKLSPEGPRLIEIGLRPAGGMITTLVRLTTNIDLYAVQALIALGNPVPQPTANGSHAAICHVVGRPQKMASQASVVEITQIPGVIDVGQECSSDTLRDSLIGNDARAGYVITHQLDATAEIQAKHAVNILAAAMGIDRH